RLVAKIPLRKINPREVLQLGRSLQQAAAIRQLIYDVEIEDLAFKNQLISLVSGIHPLEDLQDIIKNTLQDEPPVLVNKGNVIKEGIHEELDQLRKIAFSGKEYLVQIQQEESAKTGIPSLKIAYNNVFGYYLEVTNTHKDKVPEGWIRKQTLTNAERNITPELKEYEEKILGAEEKIIAIELRLYEQLIEKLQTALGPMQSNASAIA